VIAALLLFVFKLNPASGKAMYSTDAVSTNPKPVNVPVSRHSFPVTAFYGSLGTSKKPVPTR
jgi:hypothetical protein